MLTCLSYWQVIMELALDKIIEHDAAMYPLYGPIDDVGVTVHAGTTCNVRALGISLRSPLSGLTRKPISAWKGALKPLSTKPTRRTKPIGNDANTADKTPLKSVRPQWAINSTPTTPITHVRPKCMENVPILGYMDAIHNPFQNQHHD